MEHQDHGVRKEYKKTIDYNARAKPGNDLTDQNKVTFLPGTSFSSDPFTRDENGNVTDVNTDELVAEFKKQDSKRKGKKGGGKYMNHFSLTLDHGDTLTPAHFNQVVNDFMEEMGWDDTLYCSFLHSNCKHLHAHVHHHLVQNNGKTLDIFRHYEKAVNAAAKVSEKHGLKVAPNPYEQLIGTDTSLSKKAKVLKKSKSDKSRKIGESMADLDMQRTNLRRRINRVHKTKPFTMKLFVERLEKEGVQVKARENQLGVISGISYSLNGVNWHAGAKISAKHASWGSLLKPKQYGGKGIDYDPIRDNEVLGASSVLRFGVKISPVEVDKIVAMRKNFIVRKLDNDNPYIELGFFIGDGKAKQRVLNMIAWANAIRELLKLLFEVSPLVSDHHFHSTSLIYCPEQEILFETVEGVGAMDELRRDIIEEFKGIRLLGSLENQNTFATYDIRTI
ncbi:relaxase/mobilization nuclease domain-containing protein [Vibrio sp. Vb0718]|uniref:relaxase/mobilization nuclease domain-containing protein n=1 Tax=Vibrio sp. Vb0718 TaxID=3074630 RepID=UPI0029651B4C|nr:relaxase/mobilization nuclease domain-containing protein [Vibrio sp. Vb0718]MDW1835725.1 relaxase/mobilization nuclease domain-containing protein [Vibrio sp. Vb0718]